MSLKHWWHHCTYTWNCEYGIPETSMDTLVNRISLWYRQIWSMELTFVYPASSFHPLLVLCPMLTVSSIKWEPI